MITETPGVIHSPDDDLRTAVTVTLHYQPHEPLTILIDMGCVDSHGPVEWWISRDMLRESLNRPGAVIGEADLRIMTDLTQTHVTIQNQGGHATLSMRRRCLADAIRESAKLVPFGTEGEHLMIDHEVRRLLA